MLVQLIEIQSWPENILDMILIYSRTNIRRNQSPRHQRSNEFQKSTDFFPYSKTHLLEVCFIIPQASSPQLKIIGYFQSYGFKITFSPRINFCVCFLIQKEKEGKKKGERKQRRICPSSQRPHCLHQLILPYLNFHKPLSTPLPRQSSFQLNSQPPIHLLHSCLVPSSFFFSLFPELLIK